LEKLFITPEGEERTGMWEQKSTVAETGGDRNPSERAWKKKKKRLGGGKRKNSETSYVK